MTGPLQLVRIELSAPGVYGRGKVSGLPARERDDGYLLHCVLGDLFGDLSPRPFVHGQLARGRATADRSLPLLAYSRSTAGELQEAARQVADPEVYELCRWDRLLAKPLPEGWPEGRRLGFALRACPVVRQRTEDGGRRELDAFLAEALAQPEDEPVERFRVYRDWLGDHFERRGGARLVGVELERFQRLRVVRRRQGGERKARAFDRPDATFRGELEVTDGAAFTELVEAGIGRHKAFGFGMLLLSAPSSSSRGR